MYGTIAKLRVKPGKIDAMNEWSDRYESAIPGMISQYVFQQDSDPSELYLVVLFESKDAYVANAQSPDQHQRYLQYREFLDADPEWHDGTVVYPVR